MAEVCKVDQLWVPGMALDYDYPVPDTETLCEAWTDYTGSEAWATQGVYGVYIEVGRVAGIASVDLCEVVRETAHSVDTVYGANPVRRSHYKYGTWLENVDPDLETNTTVPMVQTLMNAGLVEPDENIEQIVEILQNWRRSGLLVVANTSTLPGCELATIDKFMAKYMPECFDALVLPRNHDGTGSMTKAKALQILAHELHVDLTEVPLTKIDDATHHIEGFASLFGEHSSAEYFIPKHASNKNATVGIHTDTSVEAFKLANEFYRAQGVTIYE